MKRKDIIQSGRARYRKFYRMVALSAAICVAVITGSLIVGDSVRRSLQIRVIDRLFGTKSVVVSGDTFIGSSALQELSLGEESRGVLLSEGFVSRGGRLIPVIVWGMDTLPDGSPVPEGGISVNSEFARELGDLATDPNIVLRLPDDGPVPSSSLFVTSRYSTSLRLQYNSTLGSSEGGNLNLRNSQTIPYNVFVNRKDLCEILGLEDKINVILSPGDISRGDLSRLGASTLGMHADGNRITSDGVFLKGNLVDRISSADPDAVRLYSYLVNTIGCGDSTIPYSFATAIDSWNGESLADDEAILSDYAARRLGAKAGDLVKVEYFVSDDLKNLSEKSLTFSVKNIVPISEFTSDGHLSAEFPGLSDAESCSRWDSDLPIDMDRISDEDEDYWSDYKSTPKILLPYSAMRAEWSASWGEATEVRSARAAEIVSSLSAEDFPITVVHPYDEAMDNAVGGVDFGGLFLALGCFIVAAALLLLYSPLGEMYARRKEEFTLLGELGYPSKGISSLLWREVLPVVCIGSVIGIVAAILYAGGVIFLLGNIWSGATHTDGFVLHPKPLTLMIGLASGIALSLGDVLLAIRKASSAKTKAVETKVPGILTPVTCTALTVLALVAGIVMDTSVVAFVAAGCLCLACGILWARYLAGKGDHHGKSRRSVTLQSMRHSLPEVTTSIITLALGVFITFAVGLNRKDFSNAKALEGGTGGYDLWCELTVPLQHDISTAEGRLAMSLSGLGEDASLMQFTLVGGDDASCLNLNRITTPALLGFRDGDFLESKFTVKDNIFGADSREEVLRRMGEGDTVYGLVDETVLMWGLMLSVGDTLHYTGPSGDAVDVVIAGSLPNTALQGYVLIPEKKLERHWNERGSRLILVKSSNPSAGTLLETALNEYGIRAIPATERLRLLGSVTDTYLTIFMMLGAIGLLLGIVSFAVGVRKRLASKGRDITLLRSLGYTDGAVSSMVSRENVLPPLYALVLGLVSAVVSVAVSFGAISLSTWAVCLLSTAICAFLLIRSVKAMSEDAVKNTTPEDEDSDN